MGAPKYIVLSLVLAAQALPGAALNWQKHDSTPQSHAPAPRASTPSINPHAGGNPSSSPPNVATPQLHLNGPGPHRGDWLRKYMAAPPSQQEQQLQQDPAFRGLPAEKQKHLLDRLRNFNSQPVDKKEQILNRMETYEHLTPVQQEAAQNMFQRYRNLPTDRRQQVSRAYRRLRGMPPDARAQLLSSDEYRNNFSDDERDLLRGMSDLNVGPTRPE